MNCSRRLTDTLYWVGANDRRIALFENVYPVPRGVSYNSYLLLVACAAVAVLRFMRSQKKAGKTACGCGSCSGCSGGCCCGRENAKEGA